MTSIALPRKPKTRAIKLERSPLFSLVTISECKAYPEVASETPYLVFNAAMNRLRAQGTSVLAKHINAHLLPDRRPLLQFYDATGHLCDFEVHARAEAINYDQFFDGQVTAGSHAYRFGHPTGVTFPLRIKYIDTFSQNTPCIPCIPVQDGDQLTYVPLSMLMNRAKGKVERIQKASSIETLYKAHLDKLAAKFMTPTTMFSSVPPLEVNSAVQYVAVIMQSSPDEHLVFTHEDDEPFLIAAQGASLRNRANIRYAATGKPSGQLLATPMVKGLTRKASISALVNRMIDAKVLDRDSHTVEADFVGEHEFVFSENGLSVTLYFLDGVSPGVSESITPEYATFEEEFILTLDTVWKRVKLH